MFFNKICMFSEVKSKVNEDAKIFHSCFSLNFSVIPGEIV